MFEPGEPRMPAEAGVPPTLDALERRVRSARASSEACPLEAARPLVGLERDLLVYAGDLARRDPEVADDRGLPVLSDLERWRGRCRGLGLDAAEDRGQALSRALVDDEVARWRQSATAYLASDASPAACFDVLGEATVVDREALRRRRVESGPPPLATDRVDLRRVFEERLATNPPDDALREQWTTDLLDRSDVVLTGVDDLDPAAAAAQLATAADDVDWHLRHVETARGSRRRRLGRKRRRLEAEIQERGLQDRLERMFGPRKVGRFERLVIALIFLVLVLLTLEAVLDLDPLTLYWFRIIDTLACFVFLWDFFFRLALVKGKGRWFLRHVLVDFVPSIPVGLVFLHAAGPDPIRAGRAVRLLRLARVAKYLRFLLPVIRTFRALGFLTRGVDRIVRRYGYLLNRDVILYPTREELAHARAAQDEAAVHLRRLQAEVTDLWDDLLVVSGDEEQEAVALLRVEGLEVARAEGATRRPPVQHRRVTVAREVPAEMLLERLERVTPEGAEADLGPDLVTRMARAVRLFSRPPLKWIPVLGSFFPRLGPSMSDAEVVAAAGWTAGERLRRHHERWFWFADLYGTVTPSQFVDRVGSTMVKAAFRPAYRLTMFGGVFLLAEALLYVSGLDIARTVANGLRTVVGIPLVVLGGVCFALLALGWWLKRLASEATTFYEQVALAQFLPLTESIKGRYLQRDADILTERVLGPEVLLHGGDPVARAPALAERFASGVRAWLLGAHAGGDATGAFDAMERTVLLHRDGLDGGLLHESDTRTTNQLLGNPALRHLRRNAWCVPPGERKDLLALDLERQRQLLGGPYLWFSLISRSVAHAAAHLIVEYNRHAIPISELPSTSTEERARYEAWLADGEESGGEESVEDEEARYVTAAFTALHFLDDDERRDGEVERRFGTAVRRRLQRDRHRLFRRIFGTYPLHTRPHEERVVNLYRLYENWLAGGRALLLPLRGLWGGLRWIGRVFSWVVLSVQEIRHPRSPADYDRSAESDFSTAARKIDRMRGPVVRAALWMRARMDAEYLGVRLPGERQTGFEGATAQADVAFLDVPVPLRRRIEEEHDLAQADMRRLSALMDDGLLDRIAADLGIDMDGMAREHVRAAAFAYRSDILGVRSLLSAPDVLEETFDAAPHHRVLPATWRPRPKLWWTFRRRWKTHGRGGRTERRAAWRSVVHDVNGAGRALRVWGRLGADGAEEGERRLRELLRHPGRLSGQLVTLRSVQTLALIDVLNYREHVWRLGQYADDGDDPAGLLSLSSGRHAIDRPPSTGSTTPVT